MGNRPSRNSGSSNNPYDENSFSRHPTLIDYIIKDKSWEAINYIESGQNIDIDDGIGTTPLMVASVYGRNSIIEALLKRHVADRLDYINKEDYNGNTALILACMKQKDDTALLLIRNYADVLAPRGMGRTPLMAAASEGLTRVVIEILKDRGANRHYIELRDNKYETAIQIATRKGHNYIVSIIQQKLSQLGGRRKRTRRQRKHSRKQKHRK
jgi:ankyrin repeat protein